MYLLHFFIATLIKVVHELSRGEISSDTESFHMRMKRNLPPGDPPVKLFARNYDVDKFNSDNLIAMDGKIQGVLEMFIC